MRSNNQNFFFKIQRYFNNFISIVIDKTFNKIFYDFTSIQTFNLWKFFLNVVVVVVDNSSTSTNLFVDINFAFVVRAYVEIVNVITFVQMKIKRNYNEKHKSVYMRKKNYVLIKLHYNYDIFFTTVLERKYNQQYVDFFRILKRVD